MTPPSPLVVHVGYGPLGSVVDVDRLRAIAGDVEVRCVAYDLSHAEHTRRAREPNAPHLASGEVELSAELRDALAVAEVMITMNAPLDLPSFAPRLRWIQTIGSGVGQFVPSRLPDGGIVLTNAGYPWLSYDALREVRPDLIHLHITGRHDGAPAVDYTVNAGIGFPLTTGEPGTAGPVNPVLPAWDVACGLYAAIGLLAAERHRRRTGAGRAITLPLADVALAVTGHLGFLAEGRLTAQGHAVVRPRIGNHLYGGFARDFRTGSGDSVMIVTLTARHYADLARVTGRGEALAAVESALGADFARDADRYEHREVIAALLAPWFAGHTTAEVTEALAGTSVLWERYRTFAELASDPGTLASPLVSLIDQPGIGEMLATGTPLAQPGTPQAPVPAPVLGADTDALLREVRHADGG